MFTKSEWIDQHGGQAVLDTNKTTVIPNKDGWKVVSTSIFAIAVEGVIREHSTLSVSILDPGRDKQKTAYVGNVLDQIKIVTARSLTELLEEIDRTVGL